MTWERSQSGGNDKRPAVQTTTFLFVGGYTNTSDVGIRVFDASDATSDLVEIGSNDSIEHPSYLAVHPTEDLVYAVSEVDWFDGHQLPRRRSLRLNQAATVDAISQGRLILGLGAGWNKREYDAFGFAYDKRVSRFDEAFTIIRTLLRDGEIDFHGQFFDVDRCVLHPRPDRAGHR